MDLLDLSQVEVRVPQRAIDIGIDRHVAQPIHPGLGATRHRCPNREPVEAALIRAAAVVDHDPQWKDAGLVDRYRAQRLPQRSHPTRIRQFDVIPVQVTVAILIIGVGCRPVTVEIGVRIPRVVGDRTLKNISIGRAQRRRVRVVQHECRDRTRTIALRVVAYQHEVPAPTGELGIKQLHSQHRPNR